MNDTGTRAGRFMGRTIDSPARCVADRFVPVLCAGCAGVAAASVAWLLAPTGDEFHTLAFSRLPDAGSVWRSYVAIGDTLPPAWYALAWMVGQASDGLAGIRAVSVISWALAAAVLASALRRYGPAAALTGGLLPTATTMLFVGTWGRPYSVSFLCVTLVVSGWLRSRRSTHVAVYALIAAASAGAVLLHYAALAALAAVAAAEIICRRSGPGRKVTLAALGCGLIPMVISVPLIPQAIENHQRIPTNAEPAQILRFYASLGRPILGPTLAVLLTIAMTSAARRGRIRRPATMEPEVVLGTCLLALVPALAVLGMALTSGVYWHRYAASASIGAGLLLGAFVGRSTSPTSLRTAAVGAVVLGALTSPIVAWNEHTSREQAELMPARLGLDGEDRVRIVAADAQTFELLAHVDPDLRSRLVLVNPSPYAGREAWHRPGALASPGPLQIVGRDRAVDDLLSQAQRPCTSPRRRVRIPVSGLPRTIISCDV
jgi:hypothetical protein